MLPNETRGEHFPVSPENGQNGISQSSCPRGNRTEFSGGIGRFVPRSELAPTWEGNGHFALVRKEYFVRNRPAAPTWAEMSGLIRGADYPTKPSGLSDSSRRSAHRGRKSDKGEKTK